MKQLRYCWSWIKRGLDGSILSGMTIRGGRTSPTHPSMVMPPMAPMAIFFSISVEMTCAWVIHDLLLEKMASGGKLCWYLLRRYVPWNGTINLWILIPSLIQDMSRSCWGWFWVKYSQPDICLCGLPARNDTGSLTLISVRDASRWPSAVNWNGRAWMGR